MKFAPLIMRVAAVATAVSLASCASRGGTAPKGTTPTTTSEVMRLLNTEPPSTPASPTSAAGAAPLSIQKNVPDTFPRVFIPAGGSVAAVGVSGGRTVVVSTVPAKVAFDVIHFEWKLLDAGWTNRTIGMATGGFMPRTTRPLPTTFCRGGDFVNLTYLTLESGVRLVRAAVTPEANRSCVPGPAPFLDMPIPRFELPPSITTRPSGGGSGGDRTSRARLDTTMGLQALSELCVPQLIAVGWTVQERPALDRSLSVTRLTARSKNGDPLTGLLVFASLGGDTVEAVLHVVRDKPVNPLPPGRLAQLQRDRFPDNVNDAAMLLLGRVGTETPLMQSTAPETFPRELLYPGSQVVTAGVTTATTAVVSVVPANASFDPAHFEWALEDRGWLPLGLSRFGFATGGGSQPTRCRGQEFVSWTYRLLASGDRLVRASVTTEPQPRGCTTIANRPLTRDVAIPVFDFPPDVIRIDGGSGSGSTGEASSSSRLLGPQAIEALTTLAVAQMEAAGWKREGQASTPGSTSVTRLIGRSRSDEPAIALLIFAVVGDPASVPALLIVTK